MPDVFHLNIQFLIIQYNIPLSIVFTYESVMFYCSTSLYHITLSYNKNLFNCTEHFMKLLSLIKHTELYQKVVHLSIINSAIP